MTREQAEYDVKYLPHQINVARSMGCHVGATVESAQIRKATLAKLRQRLAKAQTFIASTGEESDIGGS
jgi:hypothetical protein